MSVRSILLGGVLASLALALPGVAAGHDVHLRVAAAASIEEPCPGDPIEPDKVITGEFTDSLEGGYVFLPFDVPADITAIRVKYCFEQTGTGDQDRSTLDLGLYEPREDSSRPWGPLEFRGWGGSSHPDVILSPQGFSSEAQYAADPDRQVPGRTTRAFLPGAIPPGEWAAELGVASVASSGTVPYRVEIELSKDPSFAEDPYEPARYDRAPASTEAGWYAGDFHVHGEHSALGDAPMSEVFDYAFGSLASGRAGLDFVTLSDYVSGSSWGEVGRFQDQHPGKLIIRSAEVITYRGHAVSHANTRVTDYRHGPLYERRGDMTSRVREGRPASETFDRVLDAGGFTQIAHPTIFPSPPFPENQCRGCFWQYSKGETNYSKVDGIEIATGPAEFGPAGALGPNPFTVTGIDFWEDALASGHKVAALGASDSHNAGRTPGGFTQAPIGTATTVVYADELSQRGIQRGVRAGHTYVKVTGNDAPDLRLIAAAPGSPEPPAIMGDTLRAESAAFTARVLGGGPTAPDPGPRELIVFRDGAPFRTVPVTGDAFRFDFTGTAPGRYRLQLQRGNVIEGVSSPIYLEPERGGARTCRGRRATIVGTPGDDVIRGTPSRDVIHALAGDDVVRGRGANDLICGGAGDDELRGGARRDHIRGNGGEDLILGQRGGDDLRGGPGDDEARGGPGRDRVRGNRGADEVRGGPGRDDVGGGPGPDVVRGGPGRDTVRGGKGRNDVKQ